MNTRARSLPGPVADADLVRSVALDLLTEFEDAAVRKVGVRVSNLDFSAGEQADLTGFDGEGASERPTSRTPDTAADDAGEGQVRLTAFEEAEEGERSLGEESGDGQASLDEFS